jgi:signal transduction histidine kinase
LNKGTTSSNSLDWTIFSLRWLLVLSAVLIMFAGRTGAVNPTDTLPAALPTMIIAFGAYNILAALVLALGIGGSYFNVITLIFDSIFAVALFWGTGSTPLILVGGALLPAVVATLRFGRAYGLGLTTLIVIADLVIATATSQMERSNPALLLSVVLLGMTVGLVTLAISLGSMTTRNATDERDIEIKRARIARERAQAIYEMATTLGSTLDYDAVLNVALQVGELALRDMLPDARLVSMVLLFDGAELRIASSRGLTRQDSTLRVAAKEGLLAQALKTAEPVFGTNGNADPELNNFAAFQDTRSVLVMPLRAGYDNYGLLVFGSQDRKAFSDEYVEVLSAVATQATIALQNAVLYQNLREEKERIVEIEEEARKKLARDLHDGPTQSVAAIAMRVNYIRRLIETKPEDANEELVKVEDLARKTTKDIRHMLFTLRPLVLETQGLGPALTQFAQKVKETHDLDVTVQTQEGADDLLENHAQGVLFYIVEEAVGNARKHAQAKNIYVRLYRRENYIAVEIQDDGVGFDTEAVTTNYDQRGSLGMVNMRERAALVEGILRLESAKGKGTKISVLVPIKDSPDKQRNKPPSSPGNSGNSSNGQRRSQIISPSQ